MRRVNGRAILIAVLAASALLVSGCSVARPVPAPLTEQEREVAVQAELDRQWQLTGLEGVAPRPTAAAIPGLTLEEYHHRFSACMEQLGSNGWAWSDESGLTEVNGSPATPADQLTWYSCRAENLTMPFYSRAQLEYIYDYYAEWLIPCLELHGRRVGAAPTRAEFTGAAPADWGVWGPFFAITPPLRSHAEMLELEALCPSTTVGVEGWSR